MRQLMAVIGLQLRTELGFRSAHTGEHFFVFGDSSVHFLEETNRSPNVSILRQQGRWDDRPVAAVVTGLRDLLPSPHHDFLRSTMTRLLCLRCCCSPSLAADLDSKQFPYQDKSPSTAKWLPRPACCSSPSKKVRQRALSPIPKSLSIEDERRHGAVRPKVSGRRDERVDQRRGGRGRRTETAPE